MRDRMNKTVTVYKLRDRGIIVTDKRLIKNTSENEYDELTLIVPYSEIKEWAEEIKQLEHADDE